MASPSKPIKPLLKWAGGKFKQASVIDRLKHLRSPFLEFLYVEPFCGGLGSAHAIAPEYAILSDSNPMLIAFYQAVKDGIQFSSTYWDLLGSTDEERYYTARSLLNKNWIRLSSIGFSNHSSEDLTHFITLLYGINHGSFNGLWRENNKGDHNVPVGRNSKKVPYSVKFPDLDLWRSLYHYWVFECTGYTMWNQDPSREPHRFIYCDPPYHAGFDRYNGSGFDWSQQKDLAEWLGSLKCPVVASNRNTPEILELYKSLGFDVEVIVTRHSMKSDSKPVEEILAYRNCK